MICRLLKMIRGMPHGSGAFLRGVDTRYALFAERSSSLRCCFAVYAVGLFLICIFMTIMWIVMLPDISSRLSVSAM